MTWHSSLFTHALKYVSSFPHLGRFWRLAGPCHDHMLFLRKQIEASRSDRGRSSNHREFFSQTGLIRLIAAFDTMTLTSCPPETHLHLDDLRDLDSIMLTEDDLNQSYHHENDELEQASSTDSEPPLASQHQRRPMESSRSPFHNVTNVTSRRFRHPMIHQHNPIHRQALSSVR
jgi:hypothetical protein